MPTTIRTPCTRTFVERFWPHHRQRIKEKVAASLADPLDVARAASGLPIWINGGVVPLRPMPKDEPT